MNAFLVGCKFQVASSVEREVKKEGEADTATKKVTCNQVGNPPTEIKLTGENLLDKLSKSSSNVNSRPK